ncbi:hypothetical protein C8J57DRAFT_1126695 [Mycena rebaudengoi]|nr:hypothetical protein C8J57DRAFT_1126695 [Mycena rebaudengoi]
MMRGGFKLRQCGKCKSVWYCSKECQKNWPKHKHHCNEVDGSGILKLVKTLQANPVLDMVLQECFILDFDLLRRPRLDKPFMARVDIALEPANITDFGAIFFGQSPVGETVQGMVQVSGFTPGTPAMMRDLAPRRKEMWREARAQADTDGFRRDSIRLVEITNSGTDNSLTFPIHIRASTLKMVEQGKVLGFPSTSAITGETTILPFCVEKCMEFMNTHIRADKKNQLLLRTEMRPSDIQVICDAATNSSNLPANILMEKMAREQIYKPFLASRASKSLGTQSDQ